MTTSKPMDALAMAQHRRAPLEDTAHTRAYVDMLAEVMAFQEALVKANPSPEQVAELTQTLQGFRESLQIQELPEHERWYGRGHIAGSKTQVLLPEVTIEHVDDQSLRAHTVVGEYFMGLNHAMHGGIISALFDTIMGRLAMGTGTQVSRTAYLTTQYRNVTPVGERLEFTAQLASHEGRKRFITGQLWHGDTLCAEADALFVRLRDGDQ